MRSPPSARDDRAHALCAFERAGGELVHVSVNLAVTMRQLVMTWLIKFENHHV
jgi:hypothetical protein